MNERNSSYGLAEESSLFHYYLGFVPSILTSLYDEHCITAAPQGTINIHYYSHGAIMPIDWNQFTALGIVLMATKVYSRKYQIIRNLGWNLNFKSKHLAEMCKRTIPNKSMVKYTLC